MGERLTDTFLHLFCEKNSDGTKNLRLKGRDLWQRIGKRLKDKDMGKVAEFLSNNLSITKLDVCYNKIGDAGMATLVDEYFKKEENTLEHLNLAGCNIGPLGMQHLYSTVGTLRLKTLRINGNKLGFEGGRSTAKLLGESTTLQHLDVGDTDQTLATVQYFMSMIRHDVGTNKTLRVLDFSRVIPLSKMYQYDAAHLAESLGEMVKVNPTLVELHAQKNEFDGHNIELLLLGLRKNQTLLLLDLGFNRMGDHGIELLAKWLKQRPNLLALNVAGNNIRNTGARSPSLFTIGQIINKLGDNKEMWALSFGMPFSKLRLLDLTYNKIENTGMIDILNSIKKPYMLRYFFFWGNKFDHKTNLILQRMFRSGVLVQEQTDIRLYTVDNIIYAAYYPSNHYKHRYYCVMDHGCPIELKIKRNKLEHEYAQPRPLVKFHYYDRFPLVDESLSPKLPPC